MTNKDREKRSIHSDSSTTIEPIGTSVPKRQSQAHPIGKVISKSQIKDNKLIGQSISFSMSDHMIKVIFSVILFFPLGIAALSETYNANSYSKEGKSIQATKSLHQAGVLSSIGIVLGGIMLIALTLILLQGGY